MIPDPEGYPKDTPSWLECNQTFIDDLAKHIKKTFSDDCVWNTIPSAKPKSSDMKSHLIYKRACGGCTFCSTTPSQNFFKFNSAISSAIHLFLGVQDWSYKLAATLAELHVLFRLQWQKVGGLKLLIYWPSPFNWWPHRVLCALLTRCPIVNVAIGCHTKLVNVHIATEAPFFKKMFSPLQ